MITIKGNIRFIAVEGNMFKDSHNVKKLVRVDGIWEMNMKPKDKDSIYEDVMITQDSFIDRSDRVFSKEN